MRPLQVAEGPAGTTQSNPFCPTTCMKCALFTSLYVAPRMTEFTGRWSASRANQRC